MDICYQVETKEKLLANIQRNISNGDYILQVEDCYLGYTEVTVHYKHLQEVELSPIALGILDLLEIESPQKIEELSDIFCAHEATIYHSIQQLQYVNKVKVKGQYIVGIQGFNQSYMKVNSLSVVINPQTLKPVDIEPIYHIPTEQIIPNNIKLTLEDIAILLPNLEKEQIEYWDCHQIAGPHIYKVTIYNQLQKLQRKLLFDEAGHELYELERMEGDYSHLLLKHKHPDAVIDMDQVMGDLQQSKDNWIFAVKDRVPEGIQSFIQTSSLSSLLILDNTVPDEERRSSNLLEVRLKGKLTVFEFGHDYELLCIGRKKIFLKVSDKGFALYTDIVVNQAHVEMQANIIELAKKKSNRQALKAFIYLVEQQTEVEILKSIITELAQYSSSNDLIHRAKVLDNYGVYNILAKETYELGIQAHAREVNDNVEFNS
jgi:hypothetical protein